MSKTIKRLFNGGQLAMVKVDLEKVLAYHLAEMIETLSLELIEENTTLGKGNLTISVNWEEGEGE